MDFPTREATHRRPAKDGDEQDALTRWRHVIKTFNKPGVAKQAKQRHNRRERRQTKQRIKEARDE